MEEKKESLIRPVSEEGCNEGKQKLSYEELNNVCAELSQQNQQMQQYIQKLHGEISRMTTALQLKRLDYLFRIVEISNGANAKWEFDNNFVSSCVAEIQEAMTVPEKSEDDVEEK